MLHLKTKRTGIGALAYSPCGRWLAAAGTGGVHVWDLHDVAAAPRRFVTGQAHTPAADPAFLPDGRLFFSEWQAYRLVDPRTGAEVAHQNARHYWHSPTALSPDGRWLAGFAYHPAVWRLAADGARSEVWADADRRSAAAAFSPDSARVAVAARTVERDPSPVLAVRDAATGAVVHDLVAVYQHVDRVLFSPDGNTLVAGSGKGLAVYDLLNPGKKPKKVANPDPSHFRAAAYSPDGRRFATVSSDRVVRLWDTATWAPAAAFTWAVGKLQTVAFSPDGSTAATASSGGRVVVWDLDG